MYVPLLPLNISFSRCSHCTLSILVAAATAATAAARERVVVVAVVGWVPVEAVRHNVAGLANVDVPIVRAPLACLLKTAGTLLVSLYPCLAIVFGALRHPLRTPCAHRSALRGMVVVDSQHRCAKHGEGRNEKGSETSHPGASRIRAELPAGEFSVECERLQRS